MTFTNPIFLSTDDIYDITCYNHYIPIVRQFHHQFIERRFPGWSWYDFLPKLQGSKIVKVHDRCVDCSRLAMGLCMDSSIEGVWVKRNPSGVRVKAVYSAEQ